MARTRMLFALGILCSIVAVVPAPAQFRFDRFTDDGSSDLVLVGGIVALGALEMTPAIPTPTASAAWHAERHPIDRPFTVSIRFRFTAIGGDRDPHGNDGADGIALVLHGGPPGAVGEPGYGLGYDGIPNAIAIELDTWDDTDEWGGRPDDSSNHVAVHSSGRAPVSAIGDLNDIAVSSRAIADLSDGDVHTLTLRYEPGWLAVHVDDCELPSLVVPIRLDTLIDAPGGAAIGITAATQAAWQRHTVLAWCLAYDASCDCRPPCVPDTVDRWRTDTVTRVDTVVRERWILEIDTVYVATRPDTVDRWRDSIVYRDTGSHRIEYRERVEYRDTGSVRVEYRDTGSHRVEYRDTCGTPTLSALDTICGGQTRGMELNLWRTRIVEVAPNPASDELGVTFDLGDGAPYVLDLFTATGAHVLRIVEGTGTPGRYRARVALGGIAAGRYLARLVCGTGIASASIEVRR